jgi:mannose-6-phosphate isomerase-like protein (cupin superfamily)
MVNRRDFLAVWGMASAMFVLGGCNFVIQPTTQEKTSMSNHTNKLTHLPSGKGEHLIVVTDIVTLKAVAEDTAGDILFVEVIVPPGGGPPFLHRHKPSEVFYILDGDFEVKTADEAGVIESIQIGTGSTVRIPSMTWHNYKNVGSQNGRFLATLSPAGIEQFFREVGRPASDPLNPPPVTPPTDEQRKRIVEIASKYMEIMPPSK